MSKKARVASARNRKHQKERDIAEAEKRRALERERADAQRQKTIEQLRSGKLKLKKIKENKVPFPLPLDHQRIKREDVVIDRHTTSKKEPNPYRLEGDTGWI